MTTINVNNFLKWTSVAIKIENPNLSNSSCMKMALKELKKEKDMRNYIRTRSVNIQKENKNITRASSIMKALSEWKTM